MAFNLYKHTDGGIIMNTVFCKKLKKEENALTRAPFPGKIGIIIKNNICETAWQQWLTQQTKIMNEYRLDPMSSKTQAFLYEEMIDFLDLKEES